MNEEDRQRREARDDGRDPAFARFMVIQAVRVAGLAMFIFGVLAANGKAPWPSGAPIEWAWALALIGASEAFLVPTLLARMWSGLDR